MATSDFSECIGVNGAPAGDFDGDGDVDAGDYAMFQNCLGDPNTMVAPGCQDADLDGDADADFAEFTCLFGDE